MEPRPVFTMMKYFYDNTRLDNLRDMSREMTGALRRIEGTRIWENSAWACLNLIKDILLAAHENKYPEMKCQQSGCCCRKQVPRVSLFEVTRIMRYINETMYEEERDAIKERCLSTVSAKYESVILGTGVACPMLETGSDGKSRCAINEVKPVICWMSGVTSDMSWDCPLWKVHGKLFPKLSRDVTVPYLNLFAYCRRTFFKDNIKDRFPQVSKNQQMVLLGPVVGATLGGKDSYEEMNLTLRSMCHVDGYDPDLYMHELPPPPDEVEKTKE